jgi:hypothetical protein
MPALVYSYCLQAAQRNAVASRPTSMPHYLWHLDTDGWPIERIDTITVEHVPVFTGRPEEMLSPQDGGRPMACTNPKVSGVVSWDWV